MHHRVTEWPPLRSLHLTWSCATTRPWTWTPHCPGSRRPWWADWTDPLPVGLAPISVTNQRKGTQGRVKVW